MRYFKLNLPFLIFVLIISGISNRVLAVDISSKAQPLYGKDSTLDINKTSTIADNILLNSTGWSVNNVKNLVTFKIDEFSNLLLPDSFKVTIIYQINYKVWPSTTLQTKNDTLILTYNKSNPYINKSVAVKPGVYYSNVTVLSITSNYSSVPLTSFIKNLMLENEIQSSRYFVNFECSNNAVKTISKDLQYVNTKGELLISWPAVIEADEYDLEWSVIDQSALSEYYIDNTTTPDPNKIFENNATRVSLSGDKINYKIPLIYEKNTILFVRIRSVQVLAKNQRREANWSSNYNGGMERYDITGGLEPTLDWQATTSFAEEGKRKSVVQFYDGSLRSRQTVTKDNVTDTILVAETFYDYEGRPQIQVLPSPTLSSIIKYTPNFNPAVNGQEYDKGRYDKMISEYCGKGAEAMGTQSGASNYYSTQNANAGNGLNKFIPDAKGYPFTETKYTQDGSGRISEQGGVGAYHQLGQTITEDATSQDHQTKYFYGSADQEDLDALFGTEVGIASHYFKNMIKDANGQFSVSYADMHGRTIATGLAGTPASTKLKNISSKTTLFEIKNLLSGGNNIHSDKYTIQSVKSLLVTKASKHVFNYSLLGDSISIKDCSNQNICYDCQYDLEISITDDCNNQRMPNAQPYVFKISNFTLSDFLLHPDTTCNGVNNIIWSDSLFLTEGAYQVTKKLSLNKQAIDAYQNKIFLAHNLCKTEQQFIDSVKLAILNGIGCETTCQACTDSIGTWENYRQKFMIKLNIPVQDSATYRDLAFQSYSTEVEECDALCQKNDIDKDILAQMLDDVSPPAGQYANDANLTNSAVYPWSIFHADFSNTTKLRYQLPSTDFLDADGKPSLINGKKPEELTPLEFSDNFQNSWAKSILYLHPEYNRYLRLLKFKNSFAWDAEFNKTETYTSALSKGYLNPTGNSSAPFTTFDPGSSSSISRDPFYQICLDSFSISNKASTMQNYLTDINGDDEGVLSLWSLATISAKCSDEDEACHILYKDINNAFSSALCTADLDIAWQAFRNQYISQKNKLMFEIISQSPDGTITPSVPNPDISGDDAVHILRITVPSDGTNLLANATSGQEYKNNGNTLLNEQIANTCNSYVTQWMTELGTCLYTNTQKAQLTLQLIDVCKAGGDITHPTGSSTVPASSSHAPRSFEEVVTAFNAANGITTNVNCNADLISAPLPYDAQALSIADDEIITGHPDSCFCSKLSTLYAAYTQNSYGSTSFAAYLNSRLNINMSDGDLTKLLSLCGSSSTGSCSNLDTAISIPPALQCLKDPCISCTQVKQYYNNFRLKYPGNLVQLGDSISETQSAINHLFENYLNHLTGFKKTASEYLIFMQQCSINTSDTSLPANCNDLQTILNNFKTSYDNSAISPAITYNSDSCNINTWTFPQTPAVGTTFAFKDMFHDGVVGFPLVNGQPYNNNRVDLQLVNYRPVCNITTSGYVYETRIKAPFDSTFSVPHGILFNIPFMKNGIESNSSITLMASANYPGGSYNYGYFGASNYTNWTSYQSPYISQLKVSFANEYKVLKITSINNHLSISIDNQLIYTITLPGDILSNKMPGMQFYSCNGQTDWVKFSDLNGNVILDEEFNSGCSGFAQPTLQFACRPDCKTAFTSFYNTAKGVSFTYSQIAALYQSCGINPDPCGNTLITCGQLQNTLSSYNKSLLNITYDSSGMESMWQLGLNNYDTLHKSDKYKFRDFIRNGILSVPDSVTVLPGDFSYKQTIPMCLDKEFAVEWRTREKPGYTLSNLKLQYRFGFGTIDSFRVEFNGSGTNNGFVGTTYNSSGQQTSNLTQWVTAMGGVQFQNWTRVKIVFRVNNQVDCYINDTLKGSATFNAVVPLRSFEIAGWNNGAFEVDYVKMYDKFGGLAYNEEFNNPLNFTKPPYAWICNKPSDCQGNFTTYFNQLFSTTYTYAEIGALYKSTCNLDLNICPTSLEPKLCGTRDTFPVYNPLLKCDLAGNGATDLGTLLYNAYRDSLSNSFEDKYLKKCMNIFGRETFTVADSASEFHYTLYYYDQAGNLLKTIPPEGVNLSKMSHKQTWSDSVTAARNSSGQLTVQHGLETQYRYNTLNQVVQQKTPDAGISQFWYDRLGRLVISQNAKQFAAASTENNRNYSYTLYDGIGRITEVGEFTNPSTTVMAQTLSRDTSGLKNWLNTNANKKQVTRTVYDIPNSNWSGIATSEIPVSAANLRNRVAYTQYYPLGDPNGLNYSQATYFSYDIHGNVDTLIQDYGNASLGGNYVNAMNNNGLHNRFKRMVYKYDLISGKVNHVAYQPQYVKGSYLYRPADALYHKYQYDAENRITAVYTSIDSVIWEKDAHYDYYKHGPLARTELGEQQVQGIDYAYTIQGWLKGVNSSSLSASTDMGQDGLTTNASTRNVGRDAFGFSLNYFNNDYSSINAGVGTSTMPLHSADAGITNGLSSSNYRPLYNGNISSMVVNIGKLTIPDATGTGTTSGAMLYNYQYDQLNRLVAMDALKGLTAANNSWANIITLPHYLERITYDANGNILSYNRNGNKTSQQLMDDLTYAYNKDANGKLINNRLRHVTDAVTNSSAYDESDAASGVSDIESQDTDNYSYDAIGNLTADAKENIAAINWNVYGKITDINFGFVANKPKKITFSYDATGNRIGKQVEKYGSTSGAATTSDYTWYTRDASGNVMAIYNTTGSSGTVPSTLNVGERNLYGSSRLGVLYLTADSKTLPQASTTADYVANFIRGNKFFELSNHLGNVLSTVSDKKIPVDDGTYDANGSLINSTADGLVDYFKADVVTANDYYPFGMQMPGRKYKSLNYRYGYQKQEIDGEIFGEGNAVSYRYRMADPRIGRFFTPDPLMYKFPFNSTYAFSQNRVIDGIELEGAEVLLIGKQESASIFLGGFSEAGIAIGPNGVWGYGTGGISLSTSTSVSTGLSVTFYPTMPLVQKASGWSWEASGTAGEVGFLGGGPIYCSGYWGITGVGGIGASLGFLTEFGGLTAGASGSYTWLSPISELAKKEKSHELFIDVKQKLMDMDHDLRGDINTLTSKNQKLLIDNDALSKKLNTANSKEKANLQNKIDDNLKDVNQNQVELNRISNRLNIVDTGIKQIETELNK